VSAARAVAKKPRRTQRERRETTIKKLVDATLASLLEVGYARTTVKEICTRAGLSHGALFRFFPSVLDLVLAAAEAVAKRQIDEFEARFARAANVAAPLTTAIGLLRETCRSSTNTVFYELLIAARTDPDLRRAMRPSMERYYEAIRQTAHRVPGTEAFPPEMLEVLLFTAIHLFDGEALARIVIRDPEGEERRMALLMSFFEVVRAQQPGRGL
jgi:AcrR family transcriptional regulator